jgi:hypothetical protein
MVDERKMKRTVLARALPVFAVAVSVATASNSACAAGGGAVLSPSDIPQSARGPLEGAIAEAKKSDPKSFEDVALLRKRLPEFDAKKRGDVAMIAIPLEDMGQRALWPIVDELAFASEPPGDLGPGAWRDWRVALIEALGLIHDTRTEPVVLALLAKRDNDVPLLRASSSDAETTAIAARALGRAGSSWAWQTPALAHTGEGPGVRAAAAKALVGVLPTVAIGSSRDAVIRALTVVEDPSTVQVARDLRKKADPELARDLDKLIEKLAAPSR